MKHILIVSNRDKDKDLCFTKKIQAYIEEKGGTGYIVERNSVDGDVIDWRSLGKIDCMLVLGGDGTMIRAARDMHTDEIPMIGLNMGHLGYLCELDESDAFTAIDAIFRDEYEIEERMLLTGDILLGDKTLPAHNALNDIVIYRSGITQIVSLKLSVNGQFLTTYNGDGLLVATPTGSTAYNMSAGGPIVDPKASMIVITPINPQALSQRSIVIDDDADVVIEVLERNPLLKDPCISVAFDGDAIAQLGPGEKIHIKKAAISIKILKLSQTSFVETLRKKMNNYQ